MSKDKSYRFRLPDKVFQAAQYKPVDEDLTPAQVYRRFLRTWVSGQARLPFQVDFEGGEESADTFIRTDGGADVTTRTRL